MRAIVKTAAQIGMTVEDVPIPACGPTKAAERASSLLTPFTTLKMRAVTTPFSSTMPPE